MIQVIKQTDEEKLEMYMKCPKKKLAEMLIECHKIMDQFTKDQKPKYVVANPEILKISSIDLNPEFGEVLNHNFWELV